MALSEEMNLLIDELQAKWDELMEQECESNGEIDSTPLWHKYLDGKGLVTCLHMDFHWGSGGAIDLITHLIDLVHSGKRVIIVDDPSSEGSGHLSYLVFER